MVPSPKRRRLDPENEASSDDREQQLLEKIRRLEDENTGQKQHIDQLQASLDRAKKTIEGLQEQSKIKDQVNQQNTGLNDFITFPSITPLSPDNLVPHLQELFQELAVEAKAVGSWHEAESWFDKVEIALKDHPILAQVASKPLEDDYSCLLSSASSITWRENFFFPRGEKPFPMPTFDLLISSNPYALAWADTIYAIAVGYSTKDFDLFLSIVSKYTWVLDIDEVAAQQPIEKFLCEALLVDGDWNSVTKFYKSQPKFAKILDKSTGRYPLHEHVKNLFEVNGNSGSSPDDLIEFIVDICPAALLKQDIRGNTPLHYAFLSLQKSIQLSISSKRNSMTAGRILLKENPSALLLKNNDGCTPLECLKLRSFQDESAREFAVEVLRVYFPRPLTRSMKEIPFLPTTYAILEEEAAFANNCVRIQRVGTMIRNYCNAPTDPSNSDSDTRAEINQIYSEWATINLAAASMKIQSLRETDIPQMVRRSTSDEDVVDR